MSSAEEPALPLRDHVRAIFKSLIGSRVSLVGLLERDDLKNRCDMLDLRAVVVGLVNEGEARAIEKPGERTLYEWVGDATGIIRPGNHTPVGSDLQRMQLAVTSASAGKGREAWPTMHHLAQATGFSPIETKRLLKRLVADPKSGVIQHGIARGTRYGVGGAASSAAPLINQGNGRPLTGRAVMAHPIANPILMTDDESAAIAGDLEAMEARLKPPARQPIERLDLKLSTLARLASMAGDNVRDLLEEIQRDLREAAA